MSKLKFDPALPLYTSDGRAWRLDQFEAAMAVVRQEGKPVVLFVHGRGKEPNKAIYGATFTEGKAIHKIELGYGVRVLMFNWNSAFKGWSFLDREVPLSNTAAGAESLGRVLQQLAGYQSQNGDQAKPAMLVHSMGSIVVQKAILNGHWPAVGSLFSSVLFSQPDADDVGHAAWLEALAQRERTYVTMNKDDHVLRRSTDARPEGAQALGLGSTEPLAPHAVYVDLSRMGPTGKKDEDHEVFAKGAMNGQILVCRFFEQALTGQPVRLELGDNVESVDRGVIHKLKSQSQPGAPCLKVPTLPEF